MYMSKKYGRIRNTKTILRIDIMNRNTIISLAMLYALWESKRQDILELISPFILYAVGITTKVGEAIDVGKVCERMVDEFGYRSFQPAIVNKVLTRVSGKASHANVVERKNKSYYLKTSLDNLIENFNSRRTDCKVKSDAVTMSLSKYLNDNNVRGRTNYSQAEAEKNLLSFFEANGNSVLISVDDLNRIMSKDNEMEYFIAKYILEQNEKKSIYMDYIVELVKGYFVTTAIYLQAENPDITTSTFKDVTFYIDTAVLLALLGYKSDPENDSAQEMVKNLRKSGANLACFTYNIEEVESILNAYKNSKNQETRKASTVTLEYFDKLSYPSSHVDAELRTFTKKLFNNFGIEAVDPAKLLEQVGASNKVAGLLNDDEIESYVKKINPNYNLDTLPDDIRAINAISRIRGGKELNYIEKCKAVFVTKNTVLVSATRKYLAEQHFNPGFPIALSDSDLCVIAWLKDFKSNNNLPKMRLLENVLAVITPSQEIMNVYFSHVNTLENRGELTEDDATLLRIDQYAKKELMNITHGNPKEVHEETIFEIRERMRAKSFEEGVEKGKQDAESAERTRINEKRNSACVRAETEVNTKFKKYDRFGCVIIKLIALLVAAAFVASSCVQIYCNIKGINGEISYTLLIITVVTMVQGAWPFCTDNFWAIKLFRKRLEKEKMAQIDKKKKEYLSLVE